MPTHIPFEALKAFVEAHELRQAVLAAWDGERTHVVTYGQSDEESAQAAHGGNLVKRALGWPESLCNEEPERVKVLRARVAELEAQLIKEPGKGPADRCL